MQVWGSGTSFAIRVGASIFVTFRPLFMPPLYRWLPMLALLMLVPGQRATAQPTVPSLDQTSVASRVQASALPTATDLRVRLGWLTPIQQDEVLWLARCIYSESDRAHEQRLVAWVVRNRVETKYRGATYRNVILEPRQFSAFNAPSIRRKHLLSLNQYSLSRVWRQALEIALDVYQASASKRPFQISTRHFYSPISMEGGRTPRWAEHATPLPAARLGIDPYRFKFFADIDEDDDLPVQTVSQQQTATRASGRTRRSSAAWDRLRSRRLSGRVKRPVRPHLDRRGKQ